MFALPPGDRGVSSFCAGRFAFDDARLAPEISSLLARKMHPSADAVGDWRFCDLWAGPAWSGAAHVADAVFARAELPYLVERIEATFDTAFLSIARIFSVRRYGFIRPHRDWMGSTAAFTRLHLPLQTDATCWNSEDGIVYHMNAGEVWYLDGSRVHAGGGFSPATRLHAVIDFDASVPIERLFRNASGFAPRTPDEIIRAPFGQVQANAVSGLAAIADSATFSPLADLLGTLHFERQVDAGAAYAWLETIAAGAADASLAERARAMRQKYLGPGAAGAR